MGVPSDSGLISERGGKLREATSPPPEKVLFTVTALAAGVLLLSVLAVVFLSPIYGLVEIAVLAGGLVALYSARSLRKFVLVLLITKPLIDLTWRWHFFTVAEQGVNVQSVVGVFVVVVTALALFFWGERLVVDVKVVLFLGFAAFAALLNPSSWAVNQLVRLLAGVSFFFTAGVFLAQEASFDRFAKYFLLAVSVPVTLSFLQLSGVIPFEYFDYIGGQRLSRASGTYQHPLGMIYFLIYAIPLALYLLSTPSQTLRRRFVLWLFLCLSLVALAFTYHRTAIVVIGIEIWLWMVLNGKYRRALLITALGVAVAIGLREWLEVLYVNLADIAEGRVAFSSGSFMRGRGMNWYLFLTSLFDSHYWYWLFGRGASAAEGYVPLYGYLLSVEPHNDFIRILYAYGLLGLGLYLSILFTVVRQAIRLRQSDDHFTQQIGNLAIIMVASILLLSVTGEPMRYPTGVWYFFALASLVKVMYPRLQPRCSAANANRK